MTQVLPEGEDTNTNMMGDTTEDSENKENKKSDQNHH